MSLGPIEPISRSQFFFVTSVSIVAGGVYIWPQSVIADAGLDAPWSILLSITMALAIVWLQTAWPPGLNGETSLTRMRAIWGWVRWPIITITFCVYFALDAALIALFSQLLHIEFYPLTPRWVFGLSALGLVGWLGGKSLTQVARNAQWWFPLIVGSFFLLAGMSLANFHQGDAIRPSTVITIIPILKAVLSTWYLWIQGDIIVTIGAHVRDTPWRRIRVWALAAVGFQGIVLIIIYILVVGTLGPGMAKTLEWPMVYIFTNLTVQTIFISKPGLMIIIAWVIALVMYEMVHVFTLSLNIQDGFSLSERGRIMSVWTMVVILAVIASRLDTPLVATHLVVHWIDPIALTLTAITTLMSPLLVRWRFGPWNKRTRPS
ncbi:MAG: GerAB/ArcD/ProY family transporter [Sulfobacillus sp.]